MSGVGAAIFDFKAAEKFIKIFFELIKAKGYIVEQGFNWDDDTGLFWNKIPLKTYLMTGEKMMPGHKLVKSKLTL